MTHLEIKVTKQPGPKRFSSSLQGCSFCHCAGHNIRTCPAKKSDDALTLTEWKQLAKRNGIDDPPGNKRHKATWSKAIHRQFKQGQLPAQHIKRDRHKGK